jgi:hypothetical protein
LKEHQGVGTSDRIQDHVTTHMHIYRYFISVVVSLVQKSKCSFFLVMEPELILFEELYHLGAIEEPEPLPGLNSAMTELRDPNRSTTTIYRTFGLFSREGNTPRFSLKQEAIVVFKIFLFYNELINSRRYRETFSNGKDIEEVTLAMNFFHHFSYTEDDLAIYRHCLLTSPPPPRTALIWSIVELKSLFLRHWLAHRTQVLTQITTKALLSIQSTSLGKRRRQSLVLMNDEEEDQALELFLEGTEDFPGEGEILFLQTLIREASDLSSEVHEMIHQLL